MASRERHSLSRSWSTPVAGIWRSVGGLLSPSVLQYRSYSDEGLDDHVPPSPSAVDPLSGEFSPAVPTTRTFGAHRPVYDRNAYPLRKYEGFRVYRPIVKLSRTALNEEERPVPNYICASRNVGQESCHDYPRQGFGSSKQLQIGSACGRGNIHLQSASLASEAIAFLKHRRQQGLSIDSYMFIEILKRCSIQKDLIATRQVHDFIIQSGMQKHRYVATILLNVYIKCGRLQDAHRVFDELERTNRNVITWNVMIGAYAKRGFGMEAYRLFHQMKREGFIPDAFTYSSILNASASAGALEWVKEVHSHARRAGLESDLRVGNALVHMYAKSGSIDDARLVFDRMEKRDVITSTMMIRAYAESGRIDDARIVFDGMEKRDVVTWNIMIGAYAESGRIDDARIVFDRMEKRDVITWNIMIGAHAESGSIDDARLVFDRMEKRDVITWNRMIGAYAKRGCGMEAYRLFHQMKREAFIPDAFTYSSILNASSASAGALEWVKEVHSHARRAGLESDLRVGNALVHMYAKSGSIDDARLVFDRMEKRDVITWTIMIRAYAESGRIDDARIVFDRMEKRDVITWNIMIGAYAESGSIDDARLVFDRMEKRDVITWNRMIGAYAKRGCGMEAYRLFHQMKREGFIPDAFTYSSILNASSASAGALEWVKEVHSHARRAGLESDLRVGSGLVHMYAKSGSIDEARLVFDRMEKRDVITWTIMIRAYAESGRINDARLVFDRMEERDVITGNIMIGAYAESGRIDDARIVFDRMEKRDVITWNSMIGAYAKRGCGMEAYRLFHQMKREGFIPDAFTYSSILNASTSAGALEWVKEVHSCARGAGLGSDLRVGNALVHMYAKSGSIDDARLVFDRMEKRDVITWTTMIGAYAKRGCGMEAYRLFHQMKREGFIPDAFTYSSILNASASVGALEWVKEIHSHAHGAGLETDLRVANALVHMYAKSGSIDDARLVFDKTEKRDVVTWNIMIGGLAQHGCGHEALELFRNMIADCVKPDETSFVAILSACCHAGLLDDGRRLFAGMTQDFGIEPTVVHYTCIVDLLGRAGHLDEAKLFIGDMPVEPNGVTWKALLGGCRTYGNMKLGELAAKEVLKLEPKDASAYILLSNIYAAAGKWEKVSSVRTMMQERGVAKEPGRSWIEIDNNIHEFVVGDTSHPDAKAIYTELNKLTEKLKAEGYIPDTQLVLRNIDEEDKELALCSHSEKLAIVYGLMRTPPEKPIRVYKNLRVCSDCHRASRLISKVTGREIIARDANRFHHFKDGLCSCGDYW